MPWEYLLPQPWKNYEGQTCFMGYCRTDEDVQKFNYWRDQAIAKSNPNLCNKVSSYIAGDIPVYRPAAIEECKSAYSIEKADLKLCQSLRDDYRIPCLEGIARKTGNLSIFTKDDCSPNSEYDYGRCIQKVAILHNDKSLCNLLINQGYNQNRICLCQVEKINCEKSGGEWNEYNCENQRTPTCTIK